MFFSTNSWLSSETWAIANDFCSSFACFTCWFSSRHSCNFSATRSILMASSICPSALNLSLVMTTSSKAASTTLTSTLSPPLFMTWSTFPTVFTIRSTKSWRLSSASPSSTASNSFSTHCCPSWESTGTTFAGVAPGVAVFLEAM